MPRLVRRARSESNNALGRMSRGLRGMVGKAGCRDSDEMRIEGYRALKSRI
jgi:hypothetical protein